jgi:hypothetical protein
MRGSKAELGRGDERDVAVFREMLAQAEFLELIRCRVCRSRAAATLAGLACVTADLTHRFSVLLVSNQSRTVTPESAAKNFLQLRRSRPFAQLSRCFRLKLATSSTSNSIKTAIFEL